MADVFTPQKRSEVMPRAVAGASRARPSPERLAPVITPPPRLPLHRPRLEKQIPPSAASLPPLTSHSACIFGVDNASNTTYPARTLNSDGSENRKSPQDRTEDERGEGASLLPGDVACRVFGPDALGIAGSQENRLQITKSQRHLIAGAGILRTIPHPVHFDAKGTEHTVRFRGLLVEKHQHSDGWAAFLNQDGMVSIRPALPTEYLRRLEFQNELFGDHIQILGLTRATRFVTTQPTLRGGEPSENEIRDLLLDSGWQRVPINLQNLPSQLMGTAWWHESEELVLVDARKPNFKKTDFGILPIDLILSDLPTELLKKMKESP